MFASQFIAYLHQNPGIEAEESFPARAISGTEVPRLFSSIPAGEVFLYGEFVVFLTTVEGKSGSKILWDQLKQSVMKDIKQIQLAFKAANDPSSLLMTAGNWLRKQFQNDDSFVTAVINPNSLFVPIRSITALNTDRKWSQGNFIEIASDTNPITICQNIPDQSDTIVDLYKVAKSMLTKIWEPDFVKRLSSELSTDEYRNAA